MGIQKIISHTLSTTTVSLPILGGQSMAATPEFLPKAVAIQVYFTITRVLKALSSRNGMTQIKDNS